MDIVLFPGDSAPVTQVLRFLNCSLLPSAAVLALCAPAFASTTVELETPSGYGAYLAGQEALRDLSTSDAARYLHDASTVEWSNVAVAQQAFLADLANGNIDRAVGLANHLLDLKPDYTLAKIVVAVSELRDRRYRAVERLLDGIPTSDFAGITGAVLRAWAFVGDGRRPEAFAALDKVGKGGLEDFLVFYRALMADVAGDSADAVTLVGKAYAANPAAARTVEAYARILGNAGRFDDALAVIAKFDTQGLGDPLVDQVKTALTAHQRPGLFVENAQSGAAELLHGVAVALARDGNADLAVALLQMGLYLDPHDDVIPLLLGQLLDNANQHAEADAFYSNIPASSPMHLTAAIRIAQVTTRWVIARRRSAG